MKEQLRISWPFILAFLIFSLLSILSASGLYDVADTFWGISNILLAVTVTLACIQASKKNIEKGRYNTCLRLMYAAGILSGLWLYEGIIHLF